MAEAKLDAKIKNALANLGGENGDNAVRAASRLADNEHFARSDSGINPEVVRGEWKQQDLATLSNAIANAAELHARVDARDNNAQPSQSFSKTLNTLGGAEAVGHYKDLVAASLLVRDSKLPAPDSGLPPEEQLVKTYQARIIEDINKAGKIAEAIHSSSDNALQVPLETPKGTAAKDASQAPAKKQQGI